MSASTARTHLSALSVEVKALEPHLSDETLLDVRMALLVLTSAVNEATHATESERCQPDAAELLRTLCGDPNR